MSADKGGEVGRGEAFGCWGALVRVVKYEVGLLTEDSDEIIALGPAVGKNTHRAGGAGVLTADFEGDGGSAGAGLDGVCSGELDEVGHTDTSVGLDVFEVSAETLETPVFDVGAFVGKDQRSIAGAVEAVVERRTDSSTSGICALAVCQELFGELGGDLGPDSRTFPRRLVVSEDSIDNSTDGSNSSADNFTDTSEDLCN